MPNPQWEIILCPICRKEIHRHYASPIVSRGTVSSRIDPTMQADFLTQMMLEADRLHEEFALAAEEACTAHMREQHYQRYRLWLRFRWNWLLNGPWPWSRPLSPEKFEFGGR